MSRQGNDAPAAAERPGAKNHVPGIRVSRLGSTLQPSGERGKSLASDVLGDLMRAEVTQVNTGLAQYTLTFNNWFLSTQEERRAHRDNVGAGNSREAMDADGNVAFWPRFKYNDLGLLCFGDRLRIDMRYVPEPTGGAEDTAGKDRGNWTPMVSGPITDIQFSFASGQGAQVTVSGEDDLSALKDKQEKRVPMERHSELNIVKHLLKKFEYPLTFATPPRVPYPDFTTDDGQGIHEVVESGQSVYELIRKLADDLDFEVFLEFAKLDDPAGPLEFHFEPYRGRAVPDEALRPVYLLHRSKNLLEFSPTIKVGDQYSAAVVKGRHRDPLLAKQVKGEATHVVVQGELHIDKSKDRPLLSGPELREKFFPGRRNLFTVPNKPNLDDVRANWAARTAIRKKARELFSIEATAVGEPRLRPGRHLEIRGMRPPFDGYYYVTKTVHSFGADGYRTKISASRPGMELSQDIESRKGALS